MGNEKSRQNRINTMLISVGKCTAQHVGCDRKKLIAVFLVEYGVSEKTALSYVDALINAGKIFEENGELWIKDVENS